MHLGTDELRSGHTATDQRCARLQAKSTSRRGTVVGQAVERALVEMYARLQRGAREVALGPASSPGHEDYLRGPPAR